MTIAGTNFGATKGTSTVTFNGTSATPTSWSATSIVVPVPAGATTGNVAVTVGGLASNGLPFTVYQPQRLTSASDFDGDGKTDISVYQNTGMWSILLSSTANSTNLSMAYGLYSDIPVPGDYDGDGKTDIAVYRPSTGTWYILKSSTSFTTSMTVMLGVSTDRPVPGDYDGDGKTDVATYRPATGQWQILTSISNYTSIVTAILGGPADCPVPGDYDGDGKTDIAVYRTTGMWSIVKSSTSATLNIPYGLNTDRPVAGDYDGDGKFDIAIYRPPTGTWYVLQSSNNYSTSISAVLGITGDRLVPGDYDGDGRTDIAIYRPSTDQWRVLTSGSNYTSTSTVTFGASTDIPVPRITLMKNYSGGGGTGRNDSTRAMDFDGDRKADPTIYRPSTGTWYSLLSGSNYTANASVVLGTITDRPVGGDFDGDGQADVAVYRPSGMWSILLSGASFASGYNVPWGLSSDIPAPGDYDGDGKTDIGIYRPSNGTWYVLQSSTDFKTSISIVLGTSSGVPVPGDYDGDGRTDVALYSSGTWSVLLVEQQLHGRVYAVAGRQRRCPRSSRLRRRRQDRPGALHALFGGVVGSAVERELRDRFLEGLGIRRGPSGSHGLRRRRQGGPRHLSSVRAVGGAARERQLFNEGFRCMGAKHGRSYRPLAAVVRHLRPARFLLPRKDWPKDYFREAGLRAGDLRIGRGVSGRSSCFRSMSGRSICSITSEPAKSGGSGVIARAAISRSLALNR